MSRSCVRCVFAVLLCFVVAASGTVAQARGGVRLLPLPIPFVPKVPRVVALGASAVVAAIVVHKAIKAAKPQSGAALGSGTQTGVGSPGPEDDESCIMRLVRDPEARKEALAAIKERGKKLLHVPEEKHALLGEFLDMARKDLLKRPAPGTAGYKKTFRKRTENALGPPPSAGMDADHRVERCVGGVDCEHTNSQWLDKKDNRACGSLIGKQVKGDPPGTQYHPIPGQFPRGK